MLSVTLKLLWMIAIHAHAVLRNFPSWVNGFLIMNRNKFTRDGELRWGHGPRPVAELSYTDSVGPRLEQCPRRDTDCLG